MELHGVVEILGRAEIEVVDGDDVVVLGEMVREIRADESGTASHQNALIFHICVRSALE